MGIGKDILKMTAEWKQDQRLFRAAQAQSGGQEPKTTTVKVSFALNRRGNVVSVDVVESSGDAAYDSEAISMVRRSDPVPLPPADLTEDQFAFSLPVNFKPPDAKIKERRAQRQ